MIDEQGSVGVGSQWSCGIRRPLGMQKTKRSGSAEGRRVTRVGAGHKPWDGSKKALVRAGGVHSLGLFNKWSTGSFHVCPVPFLG